MPSVLQLREEQSGVVGVTATVWRIEHGTLSRAKLVNDRKVAEESRALSPDEVARVRSALGRADLATLGAPASRAPEANAARLVLEADGQRWETSYRTGAETAVGSPEARVHALADEIRALPLGAR